MLSSLPFPARRGLGALAGFALWLSAHAGAGAATIDFSTLSDGEFRFAGGSFDVGDSNFQNTGTGGGSVIAIDDNGFGVANNRKLVAVAGASILLTDIGSMSFTLDSFDLGGGGLSTPGNWAASLDVTATLEGGGVSTVSFALPAPGSGYTNSVLSFGPVTSVAFVPIGGAEFSIDNLAFDMGGSPPDPDPGDVPLPASLPLLVAALSVFGMLRRRKAG